VDGCTADLSELRHYHQRYKVCQDHLRVPSVVHEGIVQRFCQQCSRFHALTEFEGDKRSCRARLQRHNARRRRKAAERSSARAASASGAGAAGAGGSYRRRSTGEGRVGGDGAASSPTRQPLRSARLAARAAARSSYTQAGSDTDSEGEEDGGEDEDGDGYDETGTGTASAPSNLGGGGGCGRRRSSDRPGGALDTALGELLPRRGRGASWREAAHAVRRGAASSPAPLLEVPA